MGSRSRTAFTSSQSQRGRVGVGIGLSGGPFSPSLPELRICYADHLPL